MSTNMGRFQAVCHFSLGGRPLKLGWRFRLAAFHSPLEQGIHGEEDSRQKLTKSPNAFWLIHH